MIEHRELIAERAAVPRRPRILAAGFALLAILLLAILVVLVLRANRERDAAQAGKQRSYNVMMLTSDFDGSLARAEAALGRYVIGKDPRAGTTYYDEWRRAGRQLDSLVTLVHDDPAQVARAATLQSLFDARNRELGKVATLILYKQQWNALSLYAQAGRSAVLPDMARLLREIAASESALLDQRSSTAADTVSRSNGYARLLSAVGVLLTGSAVAAGWLAMTAFAEGGRAREAAQAEIDRTSALERAVAERTIALSDANLRLRKEAQTRAEAEARLRQVHKMDAVGQLTGGIAHDFNNMLAVVMGGLELAGRRVDEQAAEARRHIDSAMDGAARAAELTRRLLAFARAEPLLPIATDPGRLIRGMGDLIDRTIGERIEVSLDLAPGLWTIWTDPLQLENALLNLCVNARDAMGGAGRLAIAAANERVRVGEIGALAAGDHVRLSVRDEGRGMDAATLERVFEPFFTTKPVGQGTGLGLSQIFGFARQSGGDVAIESAPALGTTVALYLPRHHGIAAPGAATIDAAAPAAATDAHVLVVEDDVRVRASTGDALIELGYRPLLAASGQEALALLAERRDIGLLVTDVMMPDMTGPELVAAIRTSHPTLPTLFVTGYVGEAGDTGTFAGHAVLRKPFTIAALARSVAGALG